MSDKCPDIFRQPAKVSHNVISLYHATPTLTLRAGYSVFIDISRIILTIVSSVDDISITTVIDTTASSLSLARRQFEGTVAADTSTCFHSIRGDIVDPLRCSHWHDSILSVQLLLIQALAFYPNPRDTC